MNDHSDNGQTQGQMASENAYLAITEVIPLPPTMTWGYMHEDENWVVWSQTEKIEMSASGVWQE